MKDNIGVIQRYVDDKKVAIEFNQIIDATGNILAKVYTLAGTEVDSVNATGLSTTAGDKGEKKSVYCDFSEIPTGEYHLKFYTADEGVVAKAGLVIFGDDAFTVGTSTITDESLFYTKDQIDDNYYTKTQTDALFEDLGDLAEQDNINNDDWSGTDLAVGNGGTGASTASAARTNLGVEIGSDVQGHSENLDDISGLDPDDGNIIVGDGTDFVAESGATARTSLGLGNVDNTSDDTKKTLFKPVNDSYASTAAMIADQGNQTAGYLYFVTGSGFYEYLGTTDGDIDDYTSFASLAVVDDSITTAKLVDGSVTEAKLADDVFYALIDYLKWEQVGNDLNVSGAGTGKITALSSTRIAFIDTTNEDLRTYDFDGTDWSQTGNDLNISGIHTLSITALSSTRIAFIDVTNEDLRTYDFDGTDWSQVGNDLNISGADQAPSITALSSTRIAFIDGNNDDIRTYDFDGTDWSQVGNDLNISGMGLPRVTALSSTRIAFIDVTNEDLRTYDFDGTDWSQVGNDLNISGIGVLSITALSSTRIAFIDTTNEDLRTYDFDGTDWSQTGNDLNISGIGVPSITALSSTRIAFIDSDNDNLRTYKQTIDNTAPPSPAFT
jgi:hypothetical protein